ncbi:hypothetical protein VSR69_45455 [Paraburkholderia phytofirmans]|uniref:hypothetical protein n=1 Tax=Paraburkholderia sp. BL9I2N2 TaxID=1938809 RepID=UPI0010477717|nr:hypothetical protein [Paraburkholderia sp. BL9I2N2]
MFLRMRTPKQSSKQTAKYQYYAGYTTGFVSDILDQYGHSGARILDPWNGSGATTSACAARGFQSVGVDINPGMVPVAWSRLARPDLTKELCRRLIGTAATELCLDPGVTAGEDFAATFFDEAACAAIRGLRSTLIGYSRDLASDPGSPEELAICGAAFVVLAEVLREALRPLRGTNPSWFSRPKNESQRICLDAGSIKAMVDGVARSMCNAAGEPQAQRSPDHRWPEIVLGDSCNDLGELGPFDLVISSPPYCTRIDYAVATTPELLAFGELTKQGFESLRRRIMGAVVTDVNSVFSDDCGSNLLQKTMDAIRQHHTKAASTYYTRYFSRYFNDLILSVGQIANAVPKGHLVFVVQNSYFKEMEIDLRGIIIELVENTGFSLHTSRKYPSRPTIAGSNPRFKLYRDSNVRVEDVLIFSKHP